MEEKDPTRFGIVLSRYRAAAGLSQEQLAERAGLSVRGVSDLERGARTRPHATTVHLLAEALHLSPDDCVILEEASRKAKGTGQKASLPVDPWGTDRGVQGPAVHTFLIADIRGYTRFTSERGDEMAARLTAAFALHARACVAARDGEVLELRGDEVLAAFASPRQAMRAAVELQARLWEETASTPDLPLPVGIGVDAGEAIPVEGGYRGAALNLAARLCSLAGPGEVLTTLGVAHLAGKTDGLTYLERGPVEVKGLIEPVPVVQVMRDVGGRDDSVAPPPTLTATEPPMPIGAFLGSLPSSPMVARDDELRVIDAAIGMVAKGTGQLLMLAGSPGVGKTRLAQEVTLLTHQQGFVVACGRCSEQEHSVPLVPFVEALSIAYDAAPSRLQAQVPQRWPQVGALLAEPFHASATTAPADLPAAFPGVLRAVAGFLSTLARERPVALLFDDLHWADGASLRLLVYLAQHTRGDRVLLLGTYRDSALGHDLPLDRALKDLAHERLVERLTVHRLAAEGTAAMVAAIIGDLETTEEFTEFVHRRTRGTPRFIDELLRSLGGHYRLIREIGAGGMGRVFQAVDTQTGQSVAAKIMFASREAEADAAVRFEQEGAVLASLRHPNIVEVYGTFMDEHASCIVMELLGGQSLGELMESGSLDPGRARTIGRQIAAALVAAHRRGVVHRDIKPDNVMVLEGDRVKVTDFGIARVLRPSVTIQTMASTGMTLGTPLYMAPEQIEGKKVDGRADLYALGAVLYQLVTGRPPFAAEDALSIAIKHLQEPPVPPSRIDPTIPKEWDTVVLRALAKDPANRFQTAKEMGKAIESLPAEPDVVARPPLWSRRVAVKGVALPAPLALGIAVLLLITLTAAAIFGEVLSSPNGALAAIGKPVVNWGQGTLPQALTSPEGIAVDAQGNVYVADTGNNRIVKLSPSGHVLAIWGAYGSAPGEFEGPTYLAVDTQGNIYVKDVGNDRIQELSPNGKPLAQLATISWFPVGATAVPYARTGLAVDRLGRIYLNGSELGLGISRSSAGGTPEALGPGCGFVAGAPIGSRYVALDRHGNVYVVCDVANTSASGVAKMSPTGKVLASWTPTAALARNGGVIDGMTVDAQGHVYTLGFGVQKFTSSGTLLATWGTIGSGPGQFRLPAGIAVDSHGDIYVADTGNDRIQKLSPTGRPLAQWNARTLGFVPLRHPVSVAVASRGTSPTVYVLDDGGCRIQGFSPVGTYRRPLPIACGPGGLDAATGVAVDTFGTVYASLGDAGNIQAFSPDGEGLTEFGSPGSGTAGLLNLPQGLAVDVQGHIYVVDSGNAQIQEFSPNGTPIAQWGSMGSEPGQFEYPVAVAIDSAGDLYVADSEANCVQKLSPTGSPLVKWRRCALGHGTVPNHLRSPGGIAVDTKGNVYVADTGNNRIEKFSPAGTLLGIFGSKGSGPGQFRAPEGITVDAQGDVYVADTGNNRVQKLIPPR